MSTEIESLQSDLRRFADEREWGAFHTPKNLACALSVEAAELLEHFQWLTEAQSWALDEPKRSEVAAEMADVFLYLLQLSMRLDIDLVAAARRKMITNAKKYPVEHTKGRIAKITEG